MSNVINLSDYKASKAQDVLSDPTIAVFGISSGQLNMLMVNEPGMILLGCKGIESFNAAVKMQKKMAAKGLYYAIKGINNWAPGGSGEYCLFYLVPEQELQYVKMQVKGAVDRKKYGKSFHINYINFNTWG